jgi:hypothetical protein
MKFETWPHWSPDFAHFLSSVGLRKSDVANENWQHGPLEAMTKKTVWPELKHQSVKATKHRQYFAVPLSGGVSFMQNSSTQLLYNSTKLRYHWNNTLHVMHYRLNICWCKLHAYVFFPFSHTSYKRPLNWKVALFLLWVKKKKKDN